MKKPTLLIFVCFAVMAAIPAIGLGGKAGGFGTEDSCAASFGLEDASACGNGGGTIIANNGNGTCVWYHPALSPSVWVAPC